MKRTIRIGIRTIRSLPGAVLVLFLLAAPAQAGTPYGSGVSVGKATLVSDILARPDVYSGRTVKIEGLVVDVCSARGCWMELAGDKPYQKIRVKAEDGVIVFPVTARGRQAAVQGVVETMRMCPDEALRYRKEEARKKGVPFDPSSVNGKEASLTLRVTGAVIE